MGDLSSRRGPHRGMEAVGNNQTVRAQCRSARCSATVRTSVRATQGRATYTMQFANYYQQVPEVIAQDIIKRFRGE